MKRYFLTQQAVADALEVSRLTVNQILQGKRNITPLMALKLARVFGTSAELWYGMQKRMELFDARIEMADILPKLTPLRNMSNASLE